MGFSAAALQLAARERWVAWTPAQRASHLERVVGLSRFLIRPGVTCRDLASHVLGRVLRRLPADFEARYGYRPWLVETCVAAGQSGASLRAANFLRLGETTGRGRQDRGQRDAGSLKTMYVYELERSWRRRLGVERVEHAPVLEPGEGLDSRNWAENELGGSEMGDRRLTARLVKSASLLAEYPGQPVCGNAHCDSAAVTGYYRFIEHPSEEAVAQARRAAAAAAGAVQQGAADAAGEAGGGAGLSGVLPAAGGTRGRAAPGLAAGCGSGARGGLAGPRPAADRPSEPAAAEGRADPARGEGVLGVRGAHAVGVARQGGMPGGAGRAGLHRGRPAAVRAGLGERVVRGGHGRGGTAGAGHQQAYPELRSCSFDKGFHSPANRAALDGLLGLNALPRKGRLSGKDKEREGAEEFVQARQQHPAVESAIHNLERRGLDRVRTHGKAGFERTVALAVTAANLHRIGLLLQRRERKALRRAA